MSTGGHEKETISKLKARKKNGGRKKKCKQSRKRKRGKRRA